MRESTIARNYAEVLFELGERSGLTERYAALMEALAAAIAGDAGIHTVLESPRVSKPQKQEILARAFEGIATSEFVRFLAAVIKRGRQGVLGEISNQYLALVDDKFNRVHAGVTMAHEPDGDLREVVRSRLSELVGKEVIPHFRKDAALLGGLIVRIGDRIMDGSVRRRMMSLRRQMLG
ncbi:MAG: ATP synthase F1 subunit delta [Gemmatimonadales bacterium]